MPTARSLSPVSRGRGSWIVQMPSYAFLSSRRGHVRQVVSRVAFLNGPPARVRDVRASLCHAPFPWTTDPTKGHAVDLDAKHGALIAVDRVSVEPRHTAYAAHLSLFTLHPVAHVPVESFGV